MQHSQTPRGRTRRVRRSSFLFLLLLGACAHSPFKPGEQVHIVVVAGDVSHPEINEQAITATLVESLQPEVVLLPGDAQYGEGTPEQFAHAYEPTWGRFKSKTRPAPGNHEYKSGAAGYFAYFGELAGPAGKGFYSFDVGAWHVVSLNTGHLCANGECDEQSEQVKWLEADLSATMKKCVIAFWHHPRFNSGHHGAFLPSANFWKVLLAHHVELVFNGHEHFYERVGPVNADGEPDERDGIVQFTVGTGGIGFSDFLKPIAISRARDNVTYGVLKLELGDDAWRARFVPVPGKLFTDEASGTCR